MVGMVAWTVNETYTKEASPKLPKEWWLSATAEENFYFWLGNC